MSIADLEAALTDYVEVLSSSASDCRRSEDRPQYERHLAFAARMFVALRRDATLLQLKALVAIERHNYGWSYLSDEPGDKAESAFNAFATLVESRTSAV